MHEWEHDIVEGVDVSNGGSCVACGIFRAALEPQVVESSQKSSCPDAELHFALLFCSRFCLCLNADGYWFVAEMISVVDGDIGRWKRGADRVLQRTTGFQDNKVVDHPRRSGEG